MTQRHSPALGGGTPAALRPAASPPPHQAASIHAEGAVNSSGSWEEFYRNLPPAEQRAFIALAQRQGLLYAHQLHSPTNGVPGDSGGEVLAHLLSGRSE